MIPIRVIVCGGRSLSERLCYEWLDSSLIPTLRTVFNGPVSIERFATGMADGADTAAYMWAIENLAEDRRSEFPAQWMQYGDDAGGIRNREMFARVRPNCLIAFPGFYGTDDMVGLVQEYNSVAIDPVAIIRPKGKFK